MLEYETCLDRAPEEEVYLGEVNSSEKDGTHNHRVQGNGFQSCDSNWKVTQLSAPDKNCTRTILMFCLKQIWNTRCLLNTDSTAGLPFLHAAEKHGLS